MTFNRLKLLGLISVLAAAFVFSACGSGRPRAAHDPSRFIREHNLGKLPRFDIPIEMNERVVAWMEYFQGPGRKHFQRYMERSGRYIPLMQEIIKKNGMPSDIIYIAMIESGFNTQARSWANAVGPWQFISATGKRYGMRIDSHVDERRDPYRSTQAAMDYFRDLYDEFGDWYLAMAGYNAGEGRVRRAIASTGSRNFWEMAADRDAFRPETRDYVPKFIAAAIMAKMPERFGFQNIDYRQPFESGFEIARVETQTDLGVIARCAGVGEDDIVDLNPHLIRGATPPGARDYEIRVPRGKVRTFSKNYAALSPDERIQTTRYVVRKGDTLSRVARRYGVSSRALASANGLNYKRQHIRVGSTLTIPKGGAARYASASSEGVSKGKSSSSRKNLKHTVKRGETVSSIARRYGVSSSQLMAWNKIRKATSLRAGARLTIRGAAAPVAESSKVASASGSGAASSSSSSPGQVHKVVRGDTLSTIASRYGVTMKQLMELNDLSSAKMVKAGQSLVIRRPKTKPQEQSVQIASSDETPGETAGEEAGLAEAAPASDTAVRVASVTSADESVRFAAKTAKAKDLPAPTSAHKVGKGETLGGIAAKYGVSTKQLMEMNKIKDPRSLRAGQKIVVKAGSSAKLASASSSSEKSQSVVALPALPEPQTPQIAAAGSLSDQLVALEPQTTAVDLRERDVQVLRQTTNVASAQPVKPQAPKVSSVPKANAEAKQVSYTVKGGDTLWDIARRHKVSIAEIQKWNNLSDPSSVRPGTKLKIHKK